MSSKSSPHVPTQADIAFRASCVAQFGLYLSSAGYADCVVRRYQGAASHLLIWTGSQQISQNDIDDTVLRGFRDHDCQCVAPDGRPYARKRATFCQRTMNSLVRFHEFLEHSKYVVYPEDIDYARSFVEEFLGERSNEGYAWRTLRTYRSSVQHYLTWLQQSRIPVSASSNEVLDAFMEHDCLCPGSFQNLRTRTDSSRYLRPIEWFLRFLAARGIIPDVLPLPRKETAPELHDFCLWLRQYRGVSERTINCYSELVSKLLRDLGNDPTQYDAASLRRVFLSHTEDASLKRIQLMETSTRMYLRFLSLTENCPAGLIGAVPKTAAWSLSTLPRYISMEEVERAIASCDLTTSLGIRDRAVLLLLARLALRAGEIANLELNDIDWKNARIRVSGKSKRSSRLPLPQDVGDAILHYLEEARPRVDEGRIFLRSRAPYRPFSTSVSIGHIAKRALERAEVLSPGSRGAHLFRHSAATGLLRAGASLELVSALLRHRSPDTTAIYAKVDTPMLEEVAQPWMGDVE